MRLAETKYTPGPLKAIGPFRSGATLSFDIMVADKEIGYVASVTRVMPNDYKNSFAADAEAESVLAANVTLWSAAPEMAEALLDCLNMVDGDGCPPDWDKVREALQKAGIL